MTDYTKLIEDVIDYNASDERPRAALQSAVEALQAENERLKSIPMKYKRMEFNAQLQEENAVLQAKLDELSKQKPVGVVALYPDVVDWTGEEPPIGANLYAAPKALAPEQVEAAWRAGWEACRDAEFVGEEAEDNAWGMSETCANADGENAAPKALAPLTDEQAIDAMWKARSKWMEEAGIDAAGVQHDLPTLYAMLPYFRAGEAAHGIGGTP